MKSTVTEFNVGRYCLSEDECIAAGINFSAYERGVSDAASAFARNSAVAQKQAQAPAGQGWMPIESAPKDGTFILVYTAHGAVEVTHWYSLESAVYEDAGDGLYRKRMETYAEGWNGNFPTHWQPLPSPPTSDKEVTK